MPGFVYGRAGKGSLRKNLRGYNEAAKYGPWFVLMDLDHDEPCAPRLRRQQMPSPSPYMCFRVAVRAVESWLLADPQTLSQFLQVPLASIPKDPEKLDWPKRTMVGITATSRSRSIRDDMVPRVGSGRHVGSAYGSRMIDFVDRLWRPGVAATKSESLRRCLARMTDLVETFRASF